MRLALSDLRWRLSHKGPQAGVVFAAALVAAILTLLAGATRADARTFDSADTPDPFVLLHSGRYFAYSTNSNLRLCDGSVDFMWVPHRSSTSLRSFGSPSSPACFADVMPRGPGAWASREPGWVWAPTVFRNASNGRFVLLYTARRAGTEQMCIGRAEAGAPGGEFVADSSPLICPSGGNWAIDPNAYVSSSTHNVYLQWRQDPSAHESRLYGARYSRDGRTRVTAASLMLSSNDLSWDGGTIENAAVHYFGGNWYLYFSGGPWDSPNYATGVASCGSSITGPCSLRYTYTRPWLGWSARSGGDPFFTTPEDLPGPGGLSFASISTGGFVKGSDGMPYIAIHWWWGGPPRPFAMSRLVYSDYGPVPIDY